MDMKKVSNNINFILIMMILKRYNNEGFNYKTIKKEIEKYNEKLVDFNIELSESTFYRSISDIEKLSLMKGIDEINPFGNIFSDFVTFKDGTKKFYSIANLFELSEIRMIADLIISSKSISKIESERLLEKLFKLVNEEDEIRNNISINRNKVSNNILITLNNILLAIKRKKKVKFNYGEYDKNGNFKLKLDKNNNKKEYLLNPIDVFLKREYYYTVFSKDDKEGLSNYRIDRIKNLIITEDSFNYNFDDFNLTEHIEQSLYSYVGELENIELEFNKEILNYIIDELGEGIEITSKNEGQILKVKFQATLDKGLVKWVIGLGSNGRVLEPKSLVDEVKNEVKKMIDIYNYLK